MLDKNYYNKCSKIEKIRTILVQNQSSRSVLPTSNVGHARHYLPTRWMVIQSYSSVSQKSFANCRSVERPKLSIKSSAKLLKKTATRSMKSSMTSLIQLKGLELSVCCKKRQKKSQPKKWFGE